MNRRLFYLYSRRFLMNVISSKYISLLLLSSIFYAGAISALKEQSERAAETRSCPAPAAKFCSVNADCVNAGTVIATGVVNITNTTDTTSCANGALVVAGGVGIGGDLNVCGHATFGGARGAGLDLEELRAVPCTGPSLEVEVLGDEGISGNLYVCGNETIGGNLIVNGTLTASGGINVTGPLVISNTTQSTGCTSGALVVAGRCWYW